MGAIMAMGVATANSILLVTFANDERLEGKERMKRRSRRAFTRIRPVLMTALAMISACCRWRLGWVKAASRTRRWAAP